MKTFSLSLKIISLLIYSTTAAAQSVVPVTASTVIPTTAASPVVTATTTTTGTTTYTYNGYATMMDYYLAQSAAQQAAIAKQAEATASAQSRASSYSAMIQLAMKYCPWANSSSATSKTPRDSQRIEDKVDEQNEAAGNQREKDIDEKTQKKVGESREEVIAAEGCNDFINKAGEVGPQGRVALAVIKANPEQFEKNEPSDIKKFCPNYSQMNSEQRRLYWVWVGLSVSSSESSCDPSKNNPNAPNGTAYGYFQMAKNSCGKNMSKPSENTRCFYSTLAKELKSRGSLTTSESETKWGTLRTDDDNKARKEDVPAGQKTRALLSQYPYCKGDASADAQASVSEDSSAERKPANKERKKPASKKTKNAPEII